MKRILHVALISPEFPRYSNWGGAATFTFNLACLLSQMGHKVDVFTTGNHFSQGKSEIIENFTVHYVPFKTSSKIFNQLYYRFPFNLFRWFGKKYLPTTSFLLKWNLFSYLNFLKIQKQQPFDVIHVLDYHFSALFIGYFFNKIPLIAHIQGPQILFNIFEIKGIDRVIKAKLEVLFLDRFPDMLIAVSEDVRTYLIQHLKREANSIIHIPNFIDMKRYKSVKTFDKNAIVFWGRLEFRKGVDVLVEAFTNIASSNQKLRLYLIGKNGSQFLYNNHSISFDEYIEFASIPANIRQRIFIIPQISELHSLTEVLGKFVGIAVFPSRYEPFGYVNIEAMSLGFVTVASIHGGSGEIISDGVNGFTTAATIEQLTNKLNYILKLPKKELNQITKRGKKRVMKSYSFASVIPRYISLYNKLLKNLN